MRISHQQQPVPISRFVNKAQLMSQPRFSVCRQKKKRFRVPGLSQVLTACVFQCVYLQYQTRWRDSRSDRGSRDSRRRILPLQRWPETCWPWGRRSPRSRCRQGRKRHRLGIYRCTSAQAEDNNSPERLQHIPAGGCWFLACSQFKELIPDLPGDIFKGAGCTLAAF